MSFNYLIAEYIRLGARVHHASTHIESRISTNTLSQPNTNVFTHAHAPACTHIQGVSGNLTGDRGAFMFAKVAATVKPEVDEFGCVRDVISCPNSREN